MTAPLLPSNQPGLREVDDRRVISGILHVPQLGCRWRDCLVAYCPYTIVCNTPRIGRILTGRGRDAADVAISTTFGPSTLKSLRVWAEEGRPWDVIGQSGLCWPLG